MPATVCDLDETYAQRAVRAQFLAHVVQVAERMRQGEVLVLYAPDYRTYNAVAQVFAEFREIYLGPARSAALGEEHTAPAKRTRRDEEGSRPVAKEDRHLGATDAEAGTS